MTAALEIRCGQRQGPAVVGGPPPRGGRDALGQHQAQVVEGVALFGIAGKAREHRSRVSISVRRPWRFRRLLLAQWQQGGGTAQHRLRAAFSDGPEPVCAFLTELCVPGAAELAKLVAADVWQQDVQQLWEQGQR